MNHYAAFLFGSLKAARIVQSWSNTERFCPAHSLKTRSNLPGCTSVVAVFFFSSHLFATKRSCQRQTACMRVSLSLQKKKKKKKEKEQIAHVTLVKLCLCLTTLYETVFKQIPTNFKAKMNWLTWKLWILLTFSHLKFEQFKKNRGFLLPELIA